MASKIAFTLAFVAALGLTRSGGTDVWDNATLNNDNGNNSGNQITHGFSQVHDLGVLPGPVADQDWYNISQAPFSSYEILVDGITGDIGVSSALLELVDLTGATIQTSFPYEIGTGNARSLRFANDLGGFIPDQFIRVANQLCGTACDTQDQYRIRAWETTIAVPRYNNFGGQVTVLIIQNPAEVVVNGNARLWTAAGGLVPVTTVPFTLQGRQAVVINLATVNGGTANGTSGTITITHNGRYGGLAVKAVAVEPATGFSFDSPGLYKPVS
jgi:hypothetical protein